MKCLVPVKRVIDFNVKVRVKADESGVETEHVKMSINPFDEIALEEAVRLKEANRVTEVIAVSVGSTASLETLRLALARGADRALLIETDLELEPLNIAKLLKAVVKKEGFDLVIMGKQAIDDDCNQTGQMLAGLLNWPQGTFASKLEILQNSKVQVTREVDGGLEVVQLTLPAVITTDLRLNEPRYLSLPNVMRAKSKPLEVISLEAFDVVVKPHLNILKMEAPKTSRRSVKVQNVQELIDKLKNEAKVI